MIINCPECGHQVSDRAKTCPNCGVEIAGNKQKKKSRTAVWVIAVALVVTLSVVLGGLYMYHNMERHNEETAYLNALASNEPSVLQNYLAIYGENAPQEHIDSVEVYLDRFKAMDKEWNDAKVSRSRMALERYIKMHPGSVHEPEAKIMIDSIDWVMATHTDTQDSYRRYMDVHPDGMHYDEAMQQHDKKAEEMRHAADSLAVDGMAGQ